MKRILLILLLVCSNVFASNSSSYQFISPKPGSMYNTRESTIIIRQGDYISESSIKNDVISVRGTKSGRMNINIILSPDGKTVIAKPSQPFAPGETVNVTIRDDITNTSGQPVNAFEFSFSVTPLEVQPNPYEHIQELKDIYHLNHESMQKINDDTTENKFPEITATVYDPAALGEGYIYMAVASEVYGVGYYLMILDNDGNPVFERDLVDDYAYDFKVQPNGLMTYAKFLKHHSYTGGGDVIHMVMDNSFAVIDSFQMGNGYVAEAHDFQLLPNGHALLFGYYLTPFDISTVIEGAYPNALVSGGVIQELDQDKNVVFQWRTWDYYDFEDYDYGRRAGNQPVVSAFHLNTINLDIDNNLFIATPLWVKKINRVTGEIMWHLGGNENEFTFIGVDSTEGVDHFGGHAFHRIPNGNVLIYDNGDRNGKKSSRVHEYALDETNRTVELIWTYEPEEGIYGWHRGNAQRLPNGNTVIGWGGSSGKSSIACTEVSPDGEKIFEVIFDNAYVESYRAFRFPFPEGTPASEVTLIELAPGGPYDFSEEDVNTGVSIEINDMQGDGYNELTAKRYDYAPLYPQFFEKAPRVSPARMTLEQFAISGIDANILFDPDSWNIGNPADIIVYHREFEGQGLFLPLETYYNGALKKIVAHTTKFGEFILTSPDLESIVYIPVPISPQDSGTVNQNLPVEIRWNPIGYVNEYDFQLSLDEEFTQLIADQKFIKTAVYTMENPEDNATYYWRTKAYNDAGESEWCATQTFTTIPPFIEIESPGGGEKYQRGLDYFITWKDNIDDNVSLSLRKVDDTVWNVLDSTEANGAYKWKVDINAEVGEFLLKIENIDDSSIHDISDVSFMIIDTVTSVQYHDDVIIPELTLMQNYPNPFNPVTTIEYSLPSETIVNISIYSILGEKIVSLVNKFQEAGYHRIEWDASEQPAGMYLYQLKCNGQKQTRKMLLLK